MQEGGQITMDFVEEEYRDSVKMIMEILCVDLRQAYDLFLMSGCNVEAAINMHTNPEPEHQHDLRQVLPPARNRRGVMRNYQNYNQPPQEFIPLIDQDDEQVHYHSLPIARRRPLPGRVVQECQFDVKFNRFLEFKKKKRLFSKNYQIRRQSSSGQQSMTISRKICTHFSLTLYIVNKKSKHHQSKKLLDLKPFINQVEDNLLQRRCYIKFGKGSMSESLELSFDKKKPLLVFYLRFDKGKQSKKEEAVSLGSINVEQVDSSNNSPTKTQRQQHGKNRKRKMVIQITDSEPQQKQEKPASLQQIKNSQKLSSSKNHHSNTKNDYFKSLLMDPKLVKLINENFQSYIMDVDNYKYQSYLREYFEREDKDGSFLLVLRVNVFEEIQEVGRVGLKGVGEGVIEGNNVEQITKQQQQKQQKQKQSTLQYFTQTIRSQLKHLLQRIKSIEKDELQLHQRYRLLQMGVDSFQYIKPPSTAEKIKIKQDRELIRQQEEEFLNLESDLLGLKGEGEGEDDNNSKQKISRQELMRKRQQVRGSLKKYTADTNSIMTIKFRLPNGKSLLLSVSPTQTPNYLFSYISSLQMDNIGFQQQQDGGYCERQFDIIRPEDRMNLAQKMTLSLGEIFEGSLMQSLSVKEK